MGLEHGLSLETVQNRIYYSIFLAAKAGLITEGIDAGTHNKVNRQVGKVFVKDKEVLSSEEGRFYARQQTLREQADYDYKSKFEREQVENALENAEKFVSKMKSVVQEC